MELDSKRIKDYVQWSDEFATSSIEAISAIIKSELPVQEKLKLIKDESKDRFWSLQHDGRGAFTTLVNHTHELPQS